MNLSRFGVYLVGTKVPENIGSVARLLENYEVGQSGLVSPNCEYRTGVAQWMATGPSVKRLNALPVFSELKSAVTDANYVIGFTARSGRKRKLEMKLEDIASLQGRVALVFGREDFCLLKDEVNVCTHLCALDTAPSFPALNLSHSVAVVLSQLFLHEHDSRRGHHRLATQEELEPLFAHMRDALLALGLKSGGNPDRMMKRFRKIFQRAAMTKLDIALFRGLWSKIINWSQG